MACVNELSSTTTRRIDRRPQPSWSLPTGRCRDHFIENRYIGLSIRIELTDSLGPRRMRMLTGRSPQLVVAYLSGGM